MKRTVLSICTMVLSIVGAMSQNQNPPCIVLADADGTLPDTVVDLKNKIPMTTVGQSTYEAKGVDIEHGFAFMGESSAGSETFSFYTMPEWAVTPALVSFSNPLCVSMKRDEVIDVAPGTYDVTFVGRDATGDGYHMFKLVPSENPQEVIYPASIFLVSGGSTWLVLDGSDGVYQGDIVVPSSFKVSYEPYYGAATFIYGPASSTVAQDNVALPLSYKVNTDATISYASGSGTRHVSVDIRPGSESIRISTAGTSSVENVESGRGVSVYTDGGVVYVDGAEAESKTLLNISGMPVYSGDADAIGPFTSGMYILKVGDDVFKIAL